MPQSMTQMQEPRVVPVPTSRALANTLNRAANYARQQGHRLVGLEHVLLSLTEDEDAVAVLSSSSIELTQLRNEVAAHIGRIEDRANPQDASGPGIHPDVKRILEYAAAAAQQSRRPTINGAIVLAAIVGEGHSTAAGLLRSQGLTFEAAIHALQRAFAASSGAVRQPPDVEKAPLPSAPEPTPVTQAPPSSRVTDAILAGARERVRANRIAATDGPLPQTAHLSEPALAPVHRDPTGSAPPELSLPPASPEPTYHGQEAGAEPSTPTHSAAPPVLSLPPHPTAREEPSHPPPLANERNTEPMSPGVPPDGWSPLAAPALPPVRHPATGAPDPIPAGQYARPGARPPQFPSMPASSPHLPPMHGALVPRPIARLDARGHPLTAPQDVRNLPMPAPWPEATMPAATTADPPALPVDGDIAGAPYPAADDHQQAHPARVRATAIAGLQPGQMVDTVPRTMQVGRPETVEIRIARSSFEALAQGMPGRAQTFRHDIAVMRAMSVRLKSVDGTFWIETMSPETQWVENKPGLTYDDFASWRWSVTPRRRGRGDLQLVVTCRTVGDDGLAADTALPEHSFSIKVRRDYLAMGRVWIGRLVAMGIGAAIAKLADGTFVSVIKLVRGLTGI